MNSKGELSNQTSPTILFHREYLFDQVGLWIFTKLKWKSPIPSEFLFWCNSKEEINIGIVCSPEEEKDIENLVLDFPIHRIYKVKDLNELKQFSFQKWHNIAMYYDPAGERGSLFGESWKR